MEGRSSIEDWITDRVLRSRKIRAVGWRAGPLGVARQRRAQSGPSGSRRRTAHAAAPARASSISARIRVMALSSPVKIASPIRKCPMFNSTTSGRAAIGATVS